ncbi:MAG: hypothetical protein VB859_11245, partial [Planctomycetaceae bacterium]
MRFLSVTAVFAATAVTVMAGEFPLSVIEPAGVAHHSAPVTSGVPFAQGELRSADAVALFHAGPEQRRVPLQTEILSRWPDASVKWLLLDFQIDLKP